MYPESQAKISVFDHCLLYGDGVFEGIRIYGGKVFRLEEHIERLYESAHALWMEIPLSAEEMGKIVVDTCAVNGVEDGYIRLVVTRGKGDLGLDPRKCPTPTVICITATIKLYPDEFYENGLELVTVAVPRMHPESLNPRIKSCNYLNNVLAKIEAIQAGVIEAIMLNHQGYVAECTGDNIFMLKKGVLTTPSPAAGALKGITRDTVIELAQAEGIEVREVSDMTRYDLYNAEECFLTGTAAEIVPVIRIDGRTIGTGTPGGTTRSLLAAFREEIRK
jgi:branched-chain amino acid aminotransferase